MKDFSAVQMSAAALRRAYLVAARSHARQERAADHAAIERWFGTFDDRMKRPTSVYFGLGLGWYWPAIDAAVMEGRTSRAKSLADKAVREAGKLIEGDGSIAERTTRGDRALHYHSSALNEIVVTMEMQRALGGRPPRGLEDRLHRAVNLFIRATQDHAVLDPWAREAHNATFRPGRQDWEAAGGTSTPTAIPTAPKRSGSPARSAPAAGPHGPTRRWAWRSAASIAARGAARGRAAHPATAGTRPARCRDIPQDRMSGRCSDRARRRRSACSLASSPIGDTLRILRKMNGIE
jgi:hypothetical protein